MLSLNSGVFRAVFQFCEVSFSVVGIEEFDTQTQIFKSVVVCGSSVLFCSDAALPGL